MTHVDDLPLHTSHCGATFCKISPQFCKHEGVGGSWSLAGRRSKSCFAQMKYVMINNYAAKHSQKALHPLSCFLKCLAKRALCTVRLVTAAGLWSFSLSAISGEHSTMTFSRFIEKKPLPWRRFPVVCTVWSSLYASCSCESKAMLMLS